MVDYVVAEFGEINILYNNAASKSDDLDAFFRHLKNILWSSGERAWL